MFELLENVNASTTEEDTFMENYSTGWECKYDDVNEALLYTLIENEQNFNAIMQATMVQEANYFIENGTEMVYEAADFKAFFDKIKEAVMRAWEKIKAIYLKVNDTVSNWAPSDKLFIKKYNEEIKKANRKVQVLYRGYDISSYDKSILSDFINSTVDCSEEYKNKLGDDEYKVSDLMRSIYMKASSNKADSKEAYINYIKERLGINEKKQLKIDMFDSKKYTDIIMNTNFTKSIIREQYNIAKQVFKKLANECDIAAKEAATADSKEDTKKIRSGVRIHSDMINTCIYMAQVITNIQIKFINIMHAQALSITYTAILRYRQAVKTGEINE